MWFIKIKARFTQGSAARDVATLTIGTAISQVIAIAATPLLSRLYTPSDFGVLAVFLAISGVIATFITLRYETSILIPSENSEAANIVLLSLTLALIGATVLGLSSIFLPISARQLMGLEKLGAWLPLTFVVAGAAAVMATVQGWLNRQKSYAQMSKLRIFQSTAIIGLGLAFGCFQNIGPGLLYAQTLAYLLTAVSAFLFVGSAARIWRRHEILSVAKAHQNAPKYLLPTAILDVMTLQMPIILIANLFGESTAGQFSMAWRLLMLPMSLVGAAIGQVFLQRFAQIRADPNKAKKMIIKTWLLLFIFGISPSVFIFFFGEYIFTLILGESWREAGSIASILAPMALAMFISSPTSGTYAILGLQRFSLIFGIIISVYRPLCLFLGYNNNNIKIGIIFWVCIDIFVIFLYQFIAWKKITTNIIKC